MDSKKTKTPVIIRQGDVLITQIDKLPAGLKPVPLDKGRIVLAYGETTGHAHAIADHFAGKPAFTKEQAAEITDAAIARAQFKARLLVGENGERFLEVAEAVTLKHEEHTQHVIPPGFYHLPQQVEYVAGELQKVAD